jgi:hypothetical protein
MLWIAYKMGANAQKACIHAGLHTGCARRRGEKGPNHGHIAGILRPKSLAQRLLSAP